MLISDHHLAPLFLLHDFEKLWCFRRCGPSASPSQASRCFWEGLAGPSFWERNRLVSANTLYLNWMSIASAICKRGGQMFHEHPEDIGYWPYPSLFATDEFRCLESICGASRSCFDQCTCGGLTQKPTCASSTFVGLRDFLNNRRYPGI